MLRPFQLRKLSGPCNYCCYLERGGRGRRRQRQDNQKSGTQPALRRLETAAPRTFFVFLEIEFGTFWVSSALGCPVLRGELPLCLFVPHSPRNPPPCGALHRDLPSLVGTALDAPALCTGPEVRRTGQPQGTDATPKRMTAGQSRNQTIFKKNVLNYQSTEDSESLCRTNVSYCYLL